MVSSSVLVPIFLAATALASPLYSRAVIPVIDTITPAQWAAFNTTVGGRLNRGVPVARPCFALADPDVGGSFDLLGQCQTVQSLYKNDSFIANNFGAYQNTNWGTCQTTGQQCQLDSNAPQYPLAYTTRTCSQGSVSPYYVDVANYQDVIATFAFAGKYKVPLAIKNSGHDYKGRSSAPNSLGIWTHNLQGITRNQKYVPPGCSRVTAYDAVTYQAGTGFLQLYEFAEANNITILGGSSETVGASGGWISGAGHGALSNQLGLGVDRALEFKVVTPTGQYLTASACQNQDLFFALRGGGGGTFGVVMETTTTAAPQLTLQVAYVRFASLNLASSTQYLQILIANAQKWAAEGWGGYIEPGAMSSQASGMVLFTPLLNNSAAVASMKPVTDFATSLGNVALSNEVTQVPSFFQAYSQFLVPNEELVGLGTAIASRLIPSSNFDPANQAQLLQAIVNGMTTAGTNVLQTDSGTLAYGGAPTQILMTTPINYKNPPVSAVTPAWRTAIWHILYAPTFNYDATTQEIADSFHKATSAADFLRAITPGSGAYQNEADIHEPNHEVSFWGQANYNRLVTIKQKYDPNSLLACWHCIGWDSTQITTNQRYQCYPPA